MNTRKIAIFVEGQTEYIFVRDFLCAWYEYDVQKLGLECYQFNGNNKNTIPYPFGSKDSENFYLIYNVGNDRSVVSKMLKEVPRLQNCGYNQIVGLNDMYGDDYHASVKNRQIDINIIQKFKNERNRVIQMKKLDHLVKSYFAIMEVEAWFLGMYEYLQTIDPRLTPELIKAKLGTDVTDDPEVTVYHPAKLLNDIYNLVGKNYDKHEREICAITSVLSKTSYTELRKSGKCQSFKDFTDNII